MSFDPALIALITTLQSQLSELQSTQEATLAELRLLRQSHADLTRKVNSFSIAFENKNKRFFTTLSDLPREIVEKILVWIDPITVLKFRRVSSAFNGLLTDRRFARASMKKHIRGSEKDTSTKKPTEWDKAWFSWPTELQSEYITHRLLPLDEIDWRNTVLAATIPRSIGSLTNLKELTLYHCKLTGCIPPELGLLVNLTALRLDDNSLSGPIPVQLGNLTNLIYLCLDKNYLIGCIPKELGRLVNLRLLNLKANAFSGPVPGELKELEKLQMLYLNAAGIDPLIPTEIPVGSIVYNLLRSDGFR
ncbi:hypothetical protein HDU99_007485 [Rhizoclosmatium hyalinum]|nr:hypothetical protein HDU99_007485 [Rhizoclosmatium hyalinum]